MPLVFIIFLSLFFSKNMLVSRVSSSPFCYENSYCSEDCLCEKYQNCSLLKMEESTRTSMLYYHNKIREQISLWSTPQAAGMTLLDYDLSLEEISMCWASKCINEYSYCFLTSRYSYTSQSVIQVILASGETPDLAYWIQELNNMVRETKPIENRKFSHNFAQIISDRVLSVGCSWSVSLSNFLTFVCTYGPGGARVGTEEVAYRTGSPCSLCPEQYVCDNKEPFPNLCKPATQQAKLQSIEEEPKSTTMFLVANETAPMLPPLPTIPDSPIPTYPTIPPVPPLPSADVLFNETDYDDKRKNPDESDEDKKDKKKRGTWLMIGTMISLLVLALLCAIAAACIYSHGFGCRSF